MSLNLGVRIGAGIVGIAILLHLIGLF